MNVWRDVEIAVEIKVALIFNARVGGLGIRVESINGIIFLSGHVQDADKKELAESIAKAHGGLDVKNDIQVLSEDIVDVFRAFESDGARMKQVLGDLESDGRVNALMINVEVLDGVVYLGGLQESEVGRDRAQEIASKVPGVRDVVNRIEVRRAA